MYPFRLYKSFFFKFPETQFLSETAWSNSLVRFSYCPGDLWFQPKGQTFFHDLKKLTQSQSRMSNVAATLSRNISARKIMKQ